MPAAPDWLARSREAGGLLARGRADEAVTLFQEIARANPRLPDAQNNLAVALKAAGRVKEAVDRYRRALKLNPGYHVARLNLGRGLRHLGQHEDALRAFAVALQQGPEDEEVLFEVKATLLDMRFRRPSTVAREIMLFLFQRGGNDLQSLVGPMARLLLSNRRIERLMTAAMDAYPNGDPGLNLVPRDLADPLLVELLTWTIVPEPSMEAWITLARRQLLIRANQGTRIDCDPTLLWAIAAQCQATEWAQSVSPADHEAVGDLVAGPGQDDDARIAIAAMFLPLKSLPIAETLAREIAAESATRDPRRVLLRRAILDREAERRIEPTISVLTAVEGETSISVRAQYETNPYPKWLSVDRESRPITLAERVAKRFPNLSTDGLDLKKPRILVAGCGTGRHAVSTAARHAGCQVLAVDLSRASLAYGARQSEALGQNNLSFAQADILALGTLAERFDLIESSGVLHHMAEPSAGWRVLRGLMKPRGLMRIGLYSAHARRRWDALRATIPSGLGPDQVDTFIRDRRAALLADPPPGPESVVLRIADFYSLSGCRDLLYHTSEKHFTLPEVAAALASLELEFLSFENLSPAVTGAFAERFSAPGADRDLALWDAFERDNPDTFIAMYQFWCQARF